MMTIDSGLFDHMVMQRNRRDVSDQTITGRVPERGIVEAKVSAGGKKTLRGWNWKRVGTAARGRWQARLAGLSVGGPYRVALRVQGAGGESGEIVVDDVLVGDVWVLGGQSNMEGCGWREQALPSMPDVRAFYMTDEWDVARDPLHTLWCAVDPVHGGNPAARRHPIPHQRGVGLGVAFAIEMRKRIGIPQGLIACAHGGTRMKQWDPALKKQGGRSFYGAMLRRVRKNGGRVAGVVWYQGESDANLTEAPEFTPRVIRMVRAMRRDFGDARLPIAMVQIGCVASWSVESTPYWNSIQEQQRRLPSVLPRCTVVPAIDLALDDGIHIRGADQQRLGVRLAGAMDVLRRGRPAGLPPIEVKSIETVENPLSRWTDIIIRFANVAGRLQSDGRASGFFVRGGEDTLAAFRTEVQGDRVIHHLCGTLTRAHAALYYGYGLMPYCNVRDGADRSVPVFGPFPLVPFRLMTGFVRRLRVSPVLPPQAVETLPARLRAKSLDLAVREFPGDFCNRNPELSVAGPALVWYACRIRCAEPMSLNVLLGYDGPVKLWIDGAEAGCNPNGTNPANPDMMSVPFRATPGNHEVVVALNSNHGRAWGIFLRFERVKISNRVKSTAPVRCIMPELLD